ncbi:MAG: type IV toxin-antitoxin system AbiEi family antitoxin domain-containing protein [Gammaproteobacteria bacterium]|jgi:hypothetical protein
MVSEKRNILNRLLSTWLPGTVMLSVQLRKLGVSQQLLSHYVKSGWLKKIGQGAFTKSGDEVDWVGALYAIQTQMNLSVYVAGKTALELSGIQHFFHLGGGGVVWLFGRKGEKLPKWFLVEDTWSKWNRKIEYVTPKLFADYTMGIESRKIGTHIITDNVTEKHLSDYAIKVSSIERAILEVLYLVPSKQTLEEAKYLMEGLTTLRPELLQQLLEQCFSVKVKRLFIFLADLCDLPCLQYLDLSKIYLGKGKRVVGAGGYYIPKYQLSIPTNFVNTFKEEFKDDEE